VGHVEHADLAERDRAGSHEVDHPLRDHGVELVAGRLLELLERLLDRHPAAVQARRRHRLERVGDGEHAARERDLVALEPPRVPAAVPALVQRQYPLGDLGHARALDDVAAERRVALHLQELVLGQPRGLEQDGVGDAHLADVVEDAGGPELLDLLLRHAQLTRQHGGVLSDPGGVLVRVAVLEVDGARQRVDRVGEPGRARAVGLLLERKGGVDERGVDDAAVAARALRAVQRAVGQPHQALLIAGVARILRDPGAERQAAAALAHRHRGDRAAQPVDDALGAPGVRVGQREQELVAADAAADVAGPQLAQDHAGDHPQRLVALGVPRAVIELLEVVDVEHDHGDLLRARAGALERLVERVVQAAVVEHARERILQHEAVDPRLERLHRAAERVDRAGERPDRVAAAIAERHDRLAGADEQRAARQALERAHEQHPAQHADADQQQQEGAGARQQHLAPPGGERLRALAEDEPQAQHGHRVAAAVVDREGERRVVTVLGVGGARLRPGGRRLDLGGGQVRMRAGQPRDAGADALDVVEVARAERAGERVRERRGLRLAGPAVGVLDRRDRAIPEEPAAGERHSRRPEHEPPL